MQVGQVCGDEREPGSHLLMQPQGGTAGLHVLHREAQIAQETVVLFPETTVARGEQYQCWHVPHLIGDPKGRQRVAQPFASAFVNQYPVAWQPP
ncbi:MAG TPA: hypothetical protein DEP45_12620 [Armatimonadetes bacterium]|nr:hypothetical protein [Armatimonadota bacterium]